MIEKITIEGQEYLIDDFEGRELLEAEKVFGVNLLSGMDEPSMAVVYALIWLVKRRGNPRFSPDEAMKINLGDLSKMMGDGETEETPAGPPPARAKSAKAKAA